MKNLPNEGLGTETRVEQEESSERVDLVEEKVAAIYYYCIKVSLSERKHSAKVF